MKREQGTVTEVSEAELREKLSERRTEPRHAARLDVDVPLANWEQMRRVYTSNISKGGLMFSLTSPAAIPAAVDLRLTLPDGAEVTLQCEVRHVARCGNSNDFEVGVQFQPLTPPVQRTFDQAIARMGK
jgi:hypothetical protein